MSSEEETFQNIANQMRRKSVEISLSETLEYKPEELAKNVLAIKMLIKERDFALAESLFHQEKTGSMAEKIHQLELENERLKNKIELSIERSSFVFVFSIAATILMGIGVNFATSDNNQSVGVLLMILAMVGEGVIFFLRPKG